MKYLEWFIKWYDKLFSGFLKAVVIMLALAVLWFGCIERLWAVLEHKQYLLEHGGLKPVLEMKVGRNLKEDGIQVGIIYSDRSDVREWYQFIIKDNYFSPRFTEHLEYKKPFAGTPN